MNTEITPTNVEFNKEDYIELMESIKELEKKIKDTEVSNIELQKMIDQSIKNLSSVFNSTPNDIKRLFIADCDIMIKSRMTTGSNMDELITRVKQ